MNNYTFTNNGKKYKRISKRTARKAYEDGKSIVFCPCNMRPFSSLIIWGELNSDKDAEYPIRFDSLVNEFEWYNCNSDAGRYTAFYIEV